ncbi:helix-turn-helix domain-containing protein [Candidatus Daviesbacteria bacterium]|nr:helix-turn-helix domain-containing protein [Candidatus Daviesbacteria bacterium]
MSDPILHFTTYTAEEAAELLHVSVATIHRAIKSGRLQANKFGGKWYRINGTELLVYAGLPLPDKSEERSKLVQQFNEAIEKLSPVLTAQPGGSMAVFLHQAINLYTCNEDIRKLTADVKHFTKKLDQPEYKGRPQSILGSPTHYAYGKPIKGYRRIKIVDEEEK